VGVRALSFIGHSHVALYFVLEDGGPPETLARGSQAEDGHRLELDSERWLINPGSVGQPRDGDPRAAWLELDTEGWHATYHRVEYDIDRAASAIDEADLPEHLGRRLYSGQ
jgi:diadenosine tetraphosphatase ApaH/serine/threonine PP2A family protein phosphatase